VRRWRHGQRGSRGFWRFLDAAAVLVLLAEKPSHGYELAERLGEFGVARKGFSEMGGLYRLLSWMEEEGFVESFWDTRVPGPARRVYRITAIGHRFLNEALDRFQELCDIISRLVDRYERLERKNEGGEDKKW